MQTLEAMIAKVADGDRDAFQSLYAATSGKLFGIILTVVFDRRDAEELLQETYLNVWRKATSFDPGRGRAMTWLITIARNRAIDRYRARPTTLTTYIDEIHEVSDPARSADEHTFAAADAKRLATALNKLPPHTEAAIRSIYFDDLRYDEIAARDDISIGTIKSWVRRGITQMRVDMSTELALVIDGSVSAKCP